MLRSFTPPFYGFHFIPLDASSRDIEIAKRVFSFGVAFLGPSFGFHELLASRVRLLAAGAGQKQTSGTEQSGE